MFNLCGIIANVLPICFDEANQLDNLLLIRSTPRVADGEIPCAKNLICRTESS
jgi:hypothetical protein